MSWNSIKPEWVSLVVNALTLVTYVVRWSEPGKMLYWAGATLITAGLLLLKG